MSDNKKLFEALKKEDFNEIIREAELYRRFNEEMENVCLLNREGVEDRANMLSDIGDFLISIPVLDTLNDSTYIKPDNVLDYERVIRDTVRVLKGLGSILPTFEKGGTL